MLQPPRRLFIGLIPDRDIQARIQRHSRAWQWPADAKPTRFGRYHLTLHFLGDAVGLAPEMTLRKALRAIPMRPFELELGTPLMWQQGTAVLRPFDHPALMQLRQHVAEVLPRAGLRSPTGFTPHVTLAREAFAAMPPATGPRFTWPVREFLLVWSRLWPEVKPSRYEVLERFAANDLAPLPSGGAGEQFGLFG